MAWHHRLTRARVWAEVPAVLGLGVAGGCAGAVVAPLLQGPEEAGLPGVSRWAGEGLLAIRGFGLGWLFGILGGLALILAARRLPAPPPPSAAARAGWTAGVLIVAVAAVGAAATWPPPVTLAAALAAAIATAWIWLGWVGRRSVREPR